MKDRIQEFSVLAKSRVPEGLAVEQWIEYYNEEFAKLVAHECAYLVNDYQRKTGYTDHARMLCNKFNIEYKEQDFWGDRR